MRVRYTRPKLELCVYKSLMTHASRTLGFDDSDPAKFRLHCIELYEHVGWPGLSAAFPQLKRRTFFDWRKTYLASGKRLVSLIPRSTKPQHTRTMMVDALIVEQIERYRRAYPRLGKEKLKVLLDEWCQQKELTPVSASTIGKVITRHHMFYAGKASSKSGRTRAKPRLKHCPRAASIAPGYIQVDGTKEWAIDRYYYLFTAIDIVTKQAWVRVASTFSSRQAAALLSEVRATSLHPLHTIQTDNGSEFAGIFEEAIGQDTKLIRLYSYPRSPQTNGYIERFNWTLQDEFLHNTEAFLDQDTPQLKQDLAAWLDFYHHMRPHQSLANKRPYQYAVEEQLVRNVCN